MSFQDPVLDYEPPPPYSPAPRSLRDGVTTASSARQIPAASTAVRQHHASPLPLPRPFPQRIALIRTADRDSVRDGFAIADDPDPAQHDDLDRLRQLYGVTLAPRKSVPDAAEERLMLHPDQQELEMVIHAGPAVAEQGGPRDAEGSAAYLMPLLTARAGDVGRHHKSPETIFRFPEISPLRTDHPSGDDRRRARASSATRPVVGGEQPPGYEVRGHIIRAATSPAYASSPDSAAETTNPRPLPASARPHEAPYAVSRPHVDRHDDVWQQLEQHHREEQQRLPPHQIAQPLSGSVSADCIEETMTSHVVYPRLVYTFSVDVDRADDASTTTFDHQGQDPRTPRTNRTQTEREMFEWRISLPGDTRRGSQLQLPVFSELAGDENMYTGSWMLVRLSTRGSALGSPAVAAARADPAEAQRLAARGEITADGKEVVAIWRKASKEAGGGGSGSSGGGGGRIWDKKKGKEAVKGRKRACKRLMVFQFLGSGASGVLGERWSLMAVASAVRVYQMLINK